MKKLTLGFSPCPNDTFIFDALVNGRIDTGGLGFEAVLEDVQTLNEWAKQGKLDITKISYGSLPALLDTYILLNSGGALGKGVGPLLISKNEIPTSAVAGETVAIPGRDTTAHLLFSLAFPQAQQKKFMVFHRVEEAVLGGETKLGVIIHENRFTYQQKGLKKIMDLGEFWENRTGVPIPLGGIVAKRALGNETARQVDALIRKSLEYAFARYPAVSDYVQTHAQEMSEEVMRKHIDLYVNNYSLDLGSEGRNAVKTLLQTATNTLPPDIFIEAGGD
jgi:1,4-dihydroxy-6-naphthoate synthase